MTDGTEYFHIEGRYLDFDGKVFGEVPIETEILKFRGSKPINSLDVSLSNAIEMKRRSQRISLLVVENFTP